MKKTKAALGASLLITTALWSTANAASWQDNLSSAANQLSQNSAQSGSGLSLSSLTHLLNGGNQALSANNMNNAAGILQYCTQQKLVSSSGTAGIKEKLFDKLGLSNAQQQKQPAEFQQGLSGLLNTGKGEQLNLGALGQSPLAEKVKTKACDLVLKQGAKFISG